MAGALTGRLLNNRYLIGERIGVGGMAEVYQGQDNVLGRTVAVKVMLPQYAEDANFTTRFKQEAAAAANLQSPYIVNVYDWGQDADTSFMVMEYVRGSDLKTAINQRGAISQRKVAEIGSQVCQALAVAHNLDIVHRDIKPQNIMVQPDGNVKVMDFGIARAKNSVMAKTSAVLGTAHYISPEQAQGKELTAASDMYSLGVVLYEAVTGKLPFDGPDAVSVALKQVSELPVPPREIKPELDPGLEAIIMKAMSKNPLDRFATARDMRHALNDFLAGRPVNVGGFSGAQTALIAEPINDTANRFQTDKTSVMVPPNVDTTSQGSARITPVKSTNEHKKSRGFLIFLGVLLAIAAIAGISYALIQGNTLNPTTSEPETIETPDVTGLTFEEASAKLLKAGFTLGDPEYIYDDSTEKDVVIAQFPRAGTSQEKKTEATLTVSKGAEQVEVPDLSNMNANDARAELQRVGLKYESGTAEYSDKVKENRVLRQSPSAGEKVDKGSTVTYYLSLGVETISVPNVVGESESSATSTLENAGFKVKTAYEQNEYYYEGTVISQSPTSDEKAKNGSTVTITVSTGPEYYYAYAEVDDPEGGSVSPESVSVEPGGSVSFSITANDGYRIANVSDSNGNSYGATNAVTLTDVEGDISLSVSFEKDPDVSEDEENTSASSSSSSSTSEDTSTDDETEEGTDDTVNTEETEGTE